MVALIFSFRASGILGLRAQMMMEITEERKTEQNPANTLQKLSSLFLAD